MTEAVLAAIAAQRVLPVVRASSADAAIATCDRLLAAGLTTIELTTTIPGWQEVARRLIERAPEATIGVGTVTTADDAASACDLGAAFLVSPFPAPRAREAARSREVPFIGGGVTPAEIAESSAHGVCKLFPAHLGGPAYLRTLLAILPAARIIPTGGIAVPQVAAWLAAGAFAVGVGSDLYAAADLDATLARLAEELEAR